MSLDKAKNYLRMLKLAGREEEIIPENYEVSEEYETLTEDEWFGLPRNMKTIKEGKKHVLSYADNEFKLKPIKTDNIEDKGEPSTNKVSDYEKDGGDAEKANKKMIDNDLMDDKSHSSTDTKAVKEGVRAPIKTAKDHSDSDNRYSGVSDASARKADKLLKSKDSKLKLRSELDSNDDADEERIKARSAQKEKERQAQAKADKILSKSDLKLEAEENQVDEQFQNKQEFDDSDAEEYYGLDDTRETEVKIPSDVTKAVNDRIKEIKNSIDFYDDKGYNDGDGANSNKVKAIDAMEQIKDNLSTRDYEGFKQAQLFYQTLMSPITDLLPAELVNFLAVGTSGDEESDFGGDVEPFETSLKESYMFKRQDAFNRFFIDEVLPQVVQQYGYDDKPAIRAAYNDTLDSYQKDGMLPDSSNNWTLPDAVENNPSRYLKEDVKTLVEYGTNRFDESNTAVDTWFERDRKYVGLYPKDDEGKPDTNAKAIVEWWDEAVDEAIEDGFLDPRDWHGSALSYAKQMGVIKETKASYSMKTILESQKKKTSNPKDYKVYHKGKLIGNVLSTDPVKAARTVVHGKMYDVAGRDKASTGRANLEKKLRTEDDLEKFNLKVVSESDNNKKDTARPCWPGYKQVGWKKGIKGKKNVPNCVPEDELDDNEK